MAFYRALARYKTKNKVSASQINIEIHRLLLTSQLPPMNQVDKESNPENQIIRPVMTSQLTHLMTQPLTQVAEERALGEMCGHGACDRSLDAPKPKGTFKLDSKRQRVYREGDIRFCRQARALPR